MTSKPKLAYFQCRMQAHDGLEKTIVIGKVEERRRKGKQWIQWMDRIKEVIQTSFEQVQIIIGDKIRWWAFVHSITRAIILHVANYTALILCALEREIILYKIYLGKAS